MTVATTPARDDGAWGRDPNVVRPTERPQIMADLPRFSSAPPPHPSREWWRCPEAPQPSSVVIGSHRC